MGTDRRAVVEAISAHNDFCLVTHERPDGDALGSLLGMHLVLRALGKSSVMVLDKDDLPLPREYDFLDVGDARTSLPDDLAARTLIYLDCGNVERNPVSFHGTDHGQVVNIDHHHDNTNFGDINYVDADAACTAEMVWLLASDLSVGMTARIGEPLYVGLVTDTGKFMYENTSARCHEMAAELITAGVDTHGIYRHLYEGVSTAKLELLGRALAALERHVGGALSMVSLSRSDFDAVGAADSDGEGIIDHLRSLDGTKVAAFARVLDRVGPDGETQQKVSLRSTDGEVDVSVIARAGGGGGHQRAAGFTTSLGSAELLDFLADQISQQYTQRG
jgi:phosphoesterase RecJ-like protein